MGWLYSYNIRSKKEMVAYLRRPERFGQDHELLRATTIGNNHWYLCRNKQTGQVYIGLDKMAGGIKDGWGYKDMDESVGPCEVDCPLSYLAQASQATGYAIEWRFNVQDFHAKKSARPDPQAGQVVIYGQTRYKLVRPAGPRRGWNVQRVSDGLYFRMPSKQLAKAHLEPQP